MIIFLPSTPLHGSSCFSGGWWQKLMELQHYYVWLKVGGPLVSTILAPSHNITGRVIAGNRRLANKIIMLLNITIHQLGKKPGWNLERKHSPRSI